MGTGERHHRRSVRLKGYDYSSPGAYFVTIVAHERRLIFGQVVDGEMRPSPCGRIAEACWRQIPDHFAHVELGAFVLMPNHIHGILILHDRAATIPSPPVGATHWVAPTRARGPARGSIGAIIGAYKMAVTRMVARPGGPPHIWQRSYYEHVVRDGDEWSRIHLYIEANPSTWEMDEENPGIHTRA